jgi:hypothetical protein
VRHTVSVLLVLAVVGCADEPGCSGDTPRLRVGQSTTVTLKVEPRAETARPANYFVSDIQADHGFWKMPMRDWKTPRVPKGGVGTYTGRFTKTGHMSATLTIGSETWSLTAIGCA